MKNKIKVVEIHNTCTACPAQWEGRLADGREIYVRYRWGHLWVAVADPARFIFDDDERVIVSRQLSGDGLDGYIDYEALKETTEAEIDWPEHEGGGRSADLYQM